jgi:peptidoglycan-associated lipoprotein
MSMKRLIAGGITALVVATPAAAQQPKGGTVEIGAFGQYTEFDDRLRLDNAIGFGGRLGVFLSPRWAIEGEAGWATIKPDDREFVAGARPCSLADVSGGDDCEWTYTPLYLRLAYNIPVGRRSQIMLGAHTVRHDYDFTHEVGYGGLLGVRAGITPSLAVRLEALVDWNKTDTETPDNDDSDITIAGRAGLSLMLNTRREEAAPVVPVVTPEPTPQPQPEPQPQPQPQPQQPVTPPDRTAEVRSLIQEVIYFDFDQSDLRPEARAALDRKVPVFQAIPDMRIRISGHADSRGSDEYNIALGQRRAAAAKQYLVQRGIAEDRIEIVSYGEERPAVPNATTEEQHQQNRRDEFEIIAGGPVFRMP